MERISAVRGIIDAERAARLDRIGGDAVVDQANVGDVFGGGESGIGRGLVAERDGHRDIAVRAIVPDFRCVRLRRLLEIDQRGQRLIVHGHKLGGIARLRLGFGNDEGDVIADTTDAIGEQQPDAWSEIPSGRPTIPA